MNMRIFDIGDRVALIPEYAAVFDATEQDLHRTWIVTQVENRPESECAEVIWLDNDPEPRAAMYYCKQKN